MITGEIQRLIPPAGIFLLLKFVFSYLDWLTRPQKDRQFRDYLLRIKDECRKELIWTTWSKVISRIDAAAMKWKYVILISSIPISILINIVSFLYLKNVYSDINPRQKALLFINYDPPYFLSLIIWDIFSLCVTLALIRHMNSVHSPKRIFALSILNIILVVCLGYLQHSVGINLNSIFYAGFSTLAKIAGFPYIVNLHQLLFIILAIILISRQPYNLPKGVVVFLLTAFLYLAINILLSYYNMVKYVNFIDLSAPAPELSYVPQALARGLIVFNLSSFLPSLAYIIALSLLLLIYVLPRRVFTFLSLNVAAIANDKKTLLSRIGIICSSIGAAITYFTQ